MTVDSWSARQKLKTVVLVAAAALINIVLFALVLYFYFVLKFYFSVIVAGWLVC